MGVEEKRSGERKKIALFPGLLFPSVPYYSRGHLFISIVEQYQIKFRAEAVNLYGSYEPRFCHYLINNNYSNIVNYLYHAYLSENNYNDFLKGQKKTYEFEKKNKK